MKNYYDHSIHVYVQLTKNEVRMMFVFDCKGCMWFFIYDLV